MRRVGIRTATLAGLLGTVVGLAGCDTQAYCFDCESQGTTGDEPSGGPGGSGQGGGFEQTATTTTGSFSTGSTTPCDADVLTDPQNCGFCGNVCDLDNAFPVCEEGFCQVKECAVGHLDLDNLPLNGCEYACTPSAGGMEICDGLDNDCNGQTDELFDLTTDAFNCGACNFVCTFASATSLCEASACVLDECLVGFVDLDTLPDNGCEYACTTTAGGLEQCDLLDNDCDGDIDEDFDLQVDPEHCGTCETDCTSLFPNTVPTCDQGSCVMGPCDPDYYDVDGNQLNGCEYLCQPAVSGNELCDGEDNDCNGLVDDGMLPMVGDDCGATDVGECEFGALACVGGMLTCQGELVATVEYCDGLDNDCDNAIDDGCPVASAMDARLDVGANSAVGQANSGQLAVGSRGQSLIAAYLDRRAGNADVRANVSLDGGVTWLTASDVGVAVGASGEVEPSVAIGTTSAFVAYGLFSGNVRQIHVARAASPFSTWTSARADVRPTGTDNFFPRVVVARPVNTDIVVVAWQSLSGTNLAPANDIYLQRSTDGGSTWLAQDVRVNSVAGKAESPLLATDGADAVYIAWRDARAGAPTAYVDVYKPSAGTLAGNKSLANGAAVQDMVLSAAAGTGNVHVGWTDLRNAKKAVRVASSTDRGATFPADGTVVNADSTFADSGKLALASSAARVVAAWEDTRSGQPDIRVNVSINAGTTWQMISSRADLGDLAGKSASRAPTVALGPSPRVWISWEDDRSGATDIYGNHSFDGGLSFQPNDLRLDRGTTGAPSAAGAAQSKTPLLLLNGAGMRANVVWLDTRTSTGTQGTNADVYTNAVQ
jgi:hypothetical protein